MAKVIVHLKNGTSYETTDANLQNTKRLLGGQITGIEYGEKRMEESYLTAALDDELIVEEVSSNGVYVEEGLNLLSDDELREIASKIAVKKEISKPNARTGKDKLISFILTNQ